MPDTGSRILIVESDMQTMSAIYMALLHRNYLLEASVDAFEILLRVERFRPHLIIINRNMALADNPDVCQQLKEAYSIPLLMIGEASEADTPEMQCCQAEDTILKPVNTDLLLQKINHLLPVE